jgi:hypothetical protein
MPNTNRFYRTADQASAALNRKPESLRRSLAEMAADIGERIQVLARMAARAETGEERATALRGVEFATQQREALLEQLHSLPHETSILCEALAANEVGDEDLADAMFARLEGNEARASLQRFESRW